MQFLPLLRCLSVALVAILSTPGHALSIQPRVDDASSPLSVSQSVVSIPDPASHVNLFIGTTGAGHAFPGATLPHGMVKAGMDTDSPNNHAGYDANPIYSATGFSQLHDDGTGGSVPLSLFKIWPFASCSNDDAFEDCPTDINSRKVLRSLLADGSPDDSAEPGYFSSQPVYRYSGGAYCNSSSSIASIHVPRELDQTKTGGRPLK
ncbi:hypothetical protein A0H81_02961 [Grifola frondosa]|uniref:Glycosyl hydrolase family 92 N-terminal domain-containing protein n=1 Tax=Grifola frondosa TaxID=5627 RepID=A0A1C7MK48_GRIFR|nr:hypothetical protein A0H81_02961 [Grifola frondosa]